MFHGDISDGNVMIYPRVVVENRSSRVVWTGQLIDWECAAPVSKEGQAYPSTFW